MRPAPAPPMRPRRTRCLIRTRALGMLLACALVGCDSNRPKASSSRETQRFAAPDRALTWLRADALEWVPSNLGSLPPGFQVAVLQGDPERAGTYTIRARFPDGYRFPAHRHASDQQITVIAGSFLLAEGERFDFVRLRAHEPGDFLIAPGGAAHYGGAEGETVVQFHGIGPFEPILVDPYLPDPGG